MDAATAPTATQGLTLDDDLATQVRVVGAKAAGLARLRRAGFGVPDAVVLPVGVAEAWPAHTATPSEVRTTVQQACEALGERIAVRSSATWEDGTSRAHAGLTTTVLDVSGVDAALEAVRACLDGTRAAMASAGATGDVAVLLQRLVPADAAGVAFTADPTTGERDVVRIAATDGLGEALVQGEVVGSDATVRGGEVTGDTGPLTDAQTLAVAAIARQVEAAFGEPQDVEWALVGNDVHLLQARAITVLPVAPALPEGGGWQKDTTHYPEPLTPFGYGILEMHESGVTPAFAELGLLVKDAESALAGGEVYMRMVPAFGPTEAKGPNPPAWLLGLLARVLPPLRRLNRTARRALEHDLMGQAVRSWETIDRAWFAERDAALAAVDLPALDDAALDSFLDDVGGVATRGGLVHFRLFVPYLAAMHALHRFVGERLGWDDATTQLLLAGHSPASRAGETTMRELRSRLRATPGATAAIEAAFREPLAALSAVDAQLADDVEAWVARHGRGALNYDAGVRTLAERPSMVGRLLLADDAEPDHEHLDELVADAHATLDADGRATFDELLTLARDRYGLREENVATTSDLPLGHARRWLVEVARRLAERGILPTPDDGAYLRPEELRKALRGRPANDLSDRVRRRRGEEAWTRANPGPMALGTVSDPPDISRLPVALRTVNEPVLWAISHEYPEPPADDPSSTADLRGVAASPGVAEGAVRVIQSHADLDTLRDGEVLVCTVTTPTWAPLFPLCAAVVADGGGALAHAAIAAREHGKPAVLGTMTATSTLRDGQRVHVDGTRGEVTVLDG